MFKIGDKVRINVDVVSQNGLFDSVEQEKQYDYIVSHANEVYIIKSTNSSAPANFQFDHPIVGFTSFYKEELIPVTEEDVKPKSKEEILREQILKIMNAEDSTENYEKIAEAVFESISSDDESYSHIGYHLLYSFLNGDADGILTAICGWSMKTILAKAGLIEDDEKVFVGD